MPAEGMLLQLDGSPHRWLGPGGPRWSLLSAVDDATGEPVAALFREQEDTAGYLMLLRQIVTTLSIPAAIYRDRHSIFRSPGTEILDIDQQLISTSTTPQPTQLGRVLAELGIESIAATSPQAKGRIERSWRTHQDRLVAELRLAGVTTLEHANAFLTDYLEQYRQRFGVQPANSNSAYVPISPDVDLDRIFCCKYSRKVASDNTLRFAGQRLQLPPGRDRLSYARLVVEVHQRLMAASWCCTRAASCSTCRLHPMRLRCAPTPGAPCHVPPNRPYRFLPSRPRRLRPQPGRAPPNPPSAPLETLLPNHDPGPADTSVDRSVGHPHRSSTETVSQLSMTADFVLLNCRRILSAMDRDSVEGTVSLSPLEQRPVVLNQLPAGTLSSEQVAMLLGVPIRQLRRLEHRYQAYGQPE
jgi:hypothetical protein